MKGTRRRVFPLYFAPGRTIFHIVVKLSDAPGSYSAILNLLGRRVNLVGTTTYTLSDGTAMFSGFAESLSPRETAKELKQLIMSSKAAIETEVIAGSEGLLVDTFHTGIEAVGNEYMLLRREGLSHMFDKVAKMLGSGGEALLYEEGRSLGQRNSENMVKLIGPERVRAQSQDLSHFLTALGWGEVETVPGSGSEVARVKIKDCFECKGELTSRKGCNFFRGYFVGTSEVALGKKLEAKEVSCILKHAPACEFVLSPAM
jgi:predicted hydrocarbon binding protein